ncbi:hypothetical protein KGF54_003439 [Candida jiufengensis]|uniref:uncharacterized protein n=1 Tax=Candida jiufengensis TaxID=497108 RepID=UPI0022247BE8|nr:uncharacterized protein KGF54_003439 [Candida jiufengensis]KAI5952572.1 hypothetical protein KGF54_003439 [Candida jiufengensis]
MTSIEPKQTIYVNNINDKVSINKLRSSLQALLQNYSPNKILIQKTLKLKGQAFITFDNIEIASKAVKDLDKKELFDKPINVNFAKSNSDDVFDKDKDEINSRRNSRKESKIQKKVAESKSKLTKKKASKKDSKSTKEQPTSIDIKSWQNLPPNKILLLQNIDNIKNINKNQVEEFFEDYAGLELIRYIKPRNLSFIEFENEELSTNCLDNVDLSSLKEKFGNDIIFSYAKK